jgi:hypothetical protein
MVQLVTGFAVVFGLLGLLALFCRRGKATSPSFIRRSASLKFPLPFLRVNRCDPSDTPAPLRVMKRVSLTPTHQLHLISIDSTSLLICTHPQGCSVLHQGAEKQQECSEGVRFLAELRRHAG